MADPIKLRIHKALTTALKEITPANGYNVDLSEAVFRGRSRFGINDPLPMVSILENPEQPDSESPQNSSVVLETNSIIIQGFAKDDKDNPTDSVHPLMADVAKRLALLRISAAQDTVLGEKGIRSVEVGQYVARPPSDGVSAEAYGYVFVEIKFTHDLVDG